MFTGIVEEVGKVEAVGDGRLRISAAAVMRDLNVSDSISVNGVCLTVTEKSSDGFSVDVVPETLRRSNLAISVPETAPIWSARSRRRAAWAATWFRATSTARPQLREYRAGRRRADASLRGVRGHHAVRGREGLHSRGRYEPHDCRL